MTRTVARVTQRAPVELLKRSEHRHARGIRAILEGAKRVGAVIVSGRREIIGAVVEQLVVAHAHELGMTRVSRRAFLWVIEAEPLSHASESTPRLWFRDESANVRDLSYPA